TSSRWFGHNTITSNRDQTLGVRAITRNPDFIKPPAANHVAVQDGNRLICHQAPTQLLSNVAVYLRHDLSPSFRRSAFQLLGVLVQFRLTETFFQNLQRLMA